ncbi:tyrosine-type recombinase/integrase [Robinsoniella peoriensis]|uniref:tyrosine-type recombinase/integrase n=1 Tax=Robinsoniella peoriensis TaxID=180332 RepID=UPI001FA75F1A|nr:tyrosine-type recombinase/integrase [Robinsoniella peoriensis]
MERQLKKCLHIKLSKDVRFLDGSNAKRSEDITDKIWNEVCEFNRDMVREYLENQAELSAKTRPAYESGLKIFFVWVKDNLHNKKCIDIKKKEFVRYLNWLTNRGLSDFAIRFKKSCVSAFCNYIMMMYEEEMPTFRNFTLGLKVVKTGYVHEKIPLTPDEYIHLCEELESREEWQKLAYIVFSYSTGCRRAEARQLLKEVVDYAPKEKTITIVDENGSEIKTLSKSYLTHTIRCKGSSVVGKPRKLKFGNDAMHWLKKWLEVREDDDCPYVFVIKSKDGNTRQVAEGTFNGWCSDYMAKIVGRRFHPHLLRESRATNIVVYEHKSAEVAQKLLGHNDVSTTNNHYIIRNDENDESDEAFI